MTCLSCGHTINQRVIRYTAAGWPVCDDCLRGIRSERIEEESKLDTFTAKVVAVCAILGITLIAVAILTNIGG